MGDLVDIVSKKTGKSEKELERLLLKNDEQEDKKDTQAQFLIKLAGIADFFHDPDGNTYATFPVNTHRETWPIHAKGFRRWLGRMFYQAEGKPPSAQAMQDALGILDAKAVYDGKEYQIFTRIAEAGERIYIDLANEAWEAVEITPDGWQVVSKYPVKFRRTKGMFPLPYPVSGGSIDELRQFVNISDDDSWRLLVAWLVAALRPQGPYTVLNLQGEQGSAKTTTARVLRRLIDPSRVELRSTPRDERDLAIIANNSWVVAFDNLSGVPLWLSDAICRLATGAGFSTRTLYENDEETLFNACRPVILTGIDSLAERHDLVDRSLILTLPRIPEEKRKDEAVFWREFEEARPRILGALLDAVATGLRNIDKVKLDRLPRMADFAKWVVACESALPWQPGEFMQAYTGNRAEAIETALESDIVAVAIQEFMDEREEWTGTAGDLLKELNERVDEKTQKLRAWPKTAKGLSGRLKRAITFLRIAGIESDSYREPGTGRRMISLSKGVQRIVTTVTTVTEQPKMQAGYGFEGVTHRVTQNEGVTQNASQAKNASQLEALKTAGCDACDDCDAKSPTLSKGQVFEI